jgi:hypothetical protein
MSVGVMEDYKLRDLRASHTLGVLEAYKLRDLRASQRIELFIMNRESES